MEFVRSLGADHVINYQNEEFEQRVNNLDVFSTPWEETPSTNRLLSSDLAA